MAIAVVAVAEAVSPGVPPRAHDNILAVFLLLPYHTMLEVIPQLGEFGLREGKCFIWGVVSAFPFPPSSFVSA